MRPKAETRISPKPWGIPGEEHQLWVAFQKAGEKPPDNLAGSVGKYKIQLLLSRPGYPVASEREHKFIGDSVGDSHVVIAKRQPERGPTDIDRVMLTATAHAQQITFIGIPNTRGYLGKLVVESLGATGFHDAETQAYQALAPFLSAWSLHLDIPVHVETVEVTDLQTHTTSLRVRTPHFEMTFAGGISPLLSDDFCLYASLYREGMNSNSAFYRFLCYYKIVESIPARRARTSVAAKQSGAEVRRFREVLPAARDELLILLREVYPWRTEWDTFALDQIVPPEAMGRKIGWVREKYLNPLRVGIAHALLKSGEIRITLDRLEDIQQINKWLPLCRLLARLMLRNEFPDEFGLAMKPIIFGTGVVPSGLNTRQPS